MDGENYLASVTQQFLYYKSLGEKAMEQLEPEQLFNQLNEDGNSIAIIVQHMAGNMLSRWTDLFISDGEKEWRKRDEEFERVLEDKHAVMIKWRQGWDCFTAVLNQLQPGDLTKIIRIRNEPHTVIEAINRQLAHYPYHVGQIVFIAKTVKGYSFESLSIPKNKSTEFNRQKFSGSL